MDDDDSKERAAVCYTARQYLASLTRIFSHILEMPNWNARHSWITWILAEKTHFSSPGNDKTVRCLYLNKECSQLDGRKLYIALIQKDAGKGNAVGSCKPIACSNLFWKLLTGIINEKVYDHLNQQNLLLEEHKGCRRRTRGTKDQVLIDKAVVRNSRRRKTNLNVAWVDFRKTYDMVPYCSILKTLEIVGTATKTTELLKRNM